MLLLLQATRNCMADCTGW